MPSAGGRRVRETPCPECKDMVGVVTPPRVGDEGGPLRYKRSRHYDWALRRWCVGSSIEVPAILIFGVAA